MNKFRWIATLVISVLMGAVAVGLASAWLGQRAALATTKVVIATRDIDIGSTLAKDHLSEVQWPTESAPQGANSSADQLVGRVARSAIYRGEPVIEAKLSKPGAKAGLSSVITPGKRAVTVKVNEVVGVGGFALPGNFVDILVHLRDEKQKELSKIVLERVMVLAVAQEADRDESKPKVVSAVTLELSPDQVELLDLARSVGQLSLVLRNQFETESTATRGARRDDLFSPQVALKAAQGASAAGPAGSAPVQRVAAKPAAPRAPTAAPSRPVSVEVIRGVSRSNASVVTGQD